MTDDNIPTRTCSRCDTALERPIPDNANYVTAADLTETEPTEVHYGMVHTTETRHRVSLLNEKFENRRWQALAAESANPHADEAREVVVGEKTVEHDDSKTKTIEVKEVEFSIPEDLFEYHHIESPNEVQHDPNMAFTYTVIEEREKQKTGTVCPDCTDSNDQIMWGPDA